MAKKVGKTEKPDQTAEGYWVVRTYEAGKIGEKIKYWVQGEKPTKSKRKIKSDIKKQRQNEYSCVKRVARLLNANFEGGEDVLLTLTYSDEKLEDIFTQARAKVSDDDPEAMAKAAYDLAHHQLQVFIRRVRRACQSQGIELRYLAVTSDMDGNTGDDARLHHHMVINREVLEICKSKWYEGDPHHDYLERMDDLTKLAAYLVNQVRYQPDEKKYIPSRTLTIPQPDDRRCQTGAEVRVPKGGQLLHRNEFNPGDPQYIRYVLPPEKQCKPDSTRARGGVRTRARSSNSNSTRTQLEFNSNSTRTQPEER